MTADLHVTHGVKGLKLGPKIGPLPAGLWVVVIGAGIYVGKRRSAAAAATAEAAPAAVGDPYGRADPGMVAATVAPASTGVPTEPAASSSADSSPWSMFSDLLPDFPSSSSGDVAPSSTAPPVTAVTNPAPPPAPAVPPGRPSTRSLSSFDKVSQAKLRAGGLVAGGDGRTFQIVNGVPTTVSYARQPSRA